MPMVQELPSSSSSSGLPLSNPEMPCTSGCVRTNRPLGFVPLMLELMFASTPGAARQASEIPPVDVSVTPTQGSWMPVGKVWLGGEYRSLMFGARVDSARMTRKRSDDTGDHSKPPFQLSVLPTVE